MYTWIFIAHMFLPLGEAGIQQINNEEALLASMKTTLPAHGIYMFPKMENPADMAESEKKIAAGPSGLLIYFPTRNFEFGTMLAVELASKLVLVMIAMYLLSLRNLHTFAGHLYRLGRLPLRRSCRWSHENRRRLSTATAQQLNPKYRLTSFCISLQRSL